MTISQTVKNSNMNKKSSKTKALHIGLLISIPILMLFSIGEVAGRLLEVYAGYMPRYKVSFSSANPYIRTALIPNTTYKTGSIVIQINKYGFRGDNFNIPKKPNTFRIFAIGESSTFGWKGVNSHELAWPAQLEKRLQAAYPNQTIEIINAGVPGYTSVEQRVNYMLRISQLEPDALLIYHGNNDIDWSWAPNIKTNLIYEREVIAPADTSALNKVLELSYVYMEIRYMITQLSNATTSNQKNDEPDFTAIQMLKNNLRGLMNDSSRDGVKVAIATFAHALDEQGKPGEFSDNERELGVPSIGRWFQYLSIQGARKSYPAYNAMVRQLAKEENILLNDLTDKIPKTPEYHTDWCHLTAKGHEAIAETWFTTIQKAGWLN